MDELRRELSELAHIVGTLIAWMPADLGHEPASVLIRRIEDLRKRLLPVAAAPAGEGE